MLKILQARLQQYVNHERPEVQAAFRKGRGTRDQIANIRWIIEKAREFQRKSISALLTMRKPLTVWITINCGKFFKRWEYQTTWPASWEISMPVRKQQLELDMEQQTLTKLSLCRKKEKGIKISRSSSHWERAANLVKSFLTSSVIPGEEKWDGWQIIKINNSL